MKKLYSLIAAAILITVALQANAQSGFDNLLKSGPGDATKLINAYANPLFKGFGVGLNSGWNNTASTKKLLRFDLRITASAAFVPVSDKTFDVTKIGLSSAVTPADPTKTIAPTIGGSSNPGPVMNINDNNGKPVDQLTLPKGYTSIIPAPTVQLTIGLIQNTDVTVRAIPSISLGSSLGSVSMFGLGLKHNLMHDILGKKATVVPFDLAIAFGYSRLNLNIPVNVQPSANAQPADAQQSTDFSNQRIEGHFNSFMAQAIISKKLLFFTPFLSVGYNSTNTSVGAMGNYPVSSSSSLIGGPRYVTYTNPVTINEKSINGMRADLGFQLNLAVFRIYASYSIAQYQSVNAGIGFGF
jgi:hypothetical protein